MKDVDGVVHLAALIDVEASVRDPFETHSVNVNGTLNVLWEAVKAGVRRFVLPLPRQSMEK
jgi:UDP-glucose 4-epimerase